MTHGLRATLKIGREQKTSAPHVRNDMCRRKRLKGSSERNDISQLCPFWRCANVLKVNVYTNTCCRSIHVCARWPVPYSIHDELSRELGRIQNSNTIITICSIRFWTVLSVWIFVLIYTRESFSRFQSALRPFNLRVNMILFCLYYTYPYPTDAPREIMQAEENVEWTGCLRDMFRILFCS